MMFISTTMLAVTAFFLISGALLGFGRGAVRSVLRLLTVIVAFAIAWMGKNTYAAALLSLDAGGGKTIAESISEGQAGAYASVITPIVESLLAVLLFIGVFIVASIVTNIAYLVLKIIFRTKKNKLVGLIVGALQGALIAFVICAPLNGLICNVGQLVELEIQGEPLVPAETKAEMTKMGLDFDEYKSSAISGIYTTLGNEFYKSIASGEINGETISLSGAVEAVEAGAKFVSAFESISEINMSEGLTDASREELRDTFKELDNIKDGMSAEAKKTINTLISTVVSDTAGDAAIPEEVAEMIENLDFETVDFEEEGELIIDLIDYANNADGSEVTATELVDDLAESTVIVPMVESMVEKGEISITVPEEQREEVLSAIDQLEDAEKAETIRKLLGLN